jgi:hypothetical protein
MHDIEPHYQWRDYYIASEDERSPFFGKVNSEFGFTNRIYNYCIHPQWDEFGSSTLYMKLLYTDYEKGVAVLELIGEWNDCLHNDIMYLKRNIADVLVDSGINKFVLIAENVLNFHGGDDDYYEEWFEDIADTEGWIALINILGHVEDEMREACIHRYVRMGDHFNDFNWRKHTPNQLCTVVEKMILQGNQQLPA